MSKIQLSPRRTARFSILMFGAALGALTPPAAARSEPATPAASAAPASPDAQAREELAYAYALQALSLIHI